MTKFPKALAAVPLMAGALIATSATAQDAALRATYATVRLVAGFQPDPWWVPVQSGGNIDASKLNGCRGMVSAAPDVELTYSAGNLPLYLQTFAQSDTTLVVNGPDGRWYCDDDSGGGRNARVIFQRPQSGTYDIWIGSYGGGINNAQLRVSEVQ